MFRLVVLTAVLACVSASSTPKLDGRIVGGKPTTIEAYPHQISLRHKAQHICGGSIYQPRYVITAAHCVYGAPNTPNVPFSVVAGTSSRTGTGISKLVTSFTIHSSYNPKTTDNDIAILTLDSGFHYSDAVQPIALTSVAPVAGTIASVTGWGTTTEGGSAANILQVVDLYIVGNSQCSSNYGSGSITATMVCASIAGGGKDSCQGDSGGPLIQDGKLVGVVSWGYGCGRPLYPGVYTNVAYFKLWIEERIPLF